MSITLELVKEGLVHQRPDTMAKYQLPLAERTRFHSIVDFKVIAVEAKLKNVTGIITEGVAEFDGEYLTTPVLRGLTLWQMYVATFVFSSNGLDRLERSFKIFCR